MKITQNEMVIDYLDEYGSITALEAMRDLGIYRLASRISDLKSKVIKSKAKWYRLQLVMVEEHILRGIVGQTIM